MGQVSFFFVDRIRGDKSIGKPQVLGKIQIPQNTNLDFRALLAQVQQPQNGLEIPQKINGKNFLEELKAENFFAQPLGEVQGMRVHQLPKGSVQFDAEGRATISKDNFNKIIARIEKDTQGTEPRSILKTEGKLQKKARESGEETAHEAIYLVVINQTASQPVILQAKMEESPSPKQESVKTEIQKNPKDLKPQKAAREQKISPQRNITENQKSEIFSQTFKVESEPQQNQEPSLKESRSGTKIDSKIDTKIESMIESKNLTKKPILFVVHAEDLPKNSQNPRAASRTDQTTQTPSPFGIQESVANLKAEQTQHAIQSPRNSLTTEARNTPQISPAHDTAKTPENQQTPEMARIPKDSPVPDTARIPKDSPAPDKARIPKNSPAPDTAKIPKDLQTPEAAKIPQISQAAQRAKIDPVKTPEMQELKQQIASLLEGKEEGEIQIIQLEVREPRGEKPSRESEKSQTSDLRPKPFTLLSEKNLAATQAGLQLMRSLIQPEERGAIQNKPLKADPLKPDVKAEAVEESKPIPKAQPSASSQSSEEQPNPRFSQQMKAQIAQTVLSNFNDKKPEPVARASSETDSIQNQTRSQSPMIQTAQASGPPTPPAEPVPGSMASTYAENIAKLQEAVAQQVVKGVHGSIGSERSHISIQLQPESLGRVFVQMTVTTGQLVAQIHAEKDSTRFMLERNLAALRTAFDELGIRVEKLVVSKETFDQNRQDMTREQQERSRNARGDSDSHPSQEKGANPNGKDSQNRRNGNYWTGRLNPRDYYF